MAKNSNLGAAKMAKNDEFYTQYEDIEREMNAYLEYDENVFRGKTVLLPCDDPEWSNFTKYFAQNFERFGLKKLISTSYAIESKNINLDWEPTLFETEAPQYDVDKSKTHGKIFVLESDTTGNGRIDIEDLKWDYLDGDGDFRSEEVKRLRDEADIIITNPPFSLLREFFAWLIESGKDFAFIGNQNAITYKEIFPYIKENKVWLGNGFHRGDAYFRVPIVGKYEGQDFFNAEENIVHFRNCNWFTNIDHGRRHQPLQLMTVADNIKYSRHKDIRGIGYKKYENYDAIDIPYTDAIPSDYEGVMGVPLTFLDKYCPDQFDIIWRTGDIEWAEKECNFFTPPSKELSDLYKKRDKTWRVQNPYILTENGFPQCIYFRILIRKK